MVNKIKMKTLSLFVVLMLTAHALKVESDNNNSFLNFLEESEDSEQNKAPKYGEPTLLFNAKHREAPKFIETAETAEELLEELDQVALEEQEAIPAVLLEQVPHAKATAKPPPAKEHFQFPSFIDESNEALLDLEEEQISASKRFSEPLRMYKTHELFINSLHKIIFGEHYDEVNEMMQKCEARIAPHADADLKQTHKIWQNIRWTYCYKDDRSKNFFEILKDALEIYGNNLHACHDLWGNTKLAEYVDGWMDWNRQIQDYRDKLKVFRSMDAEKTNREGSIDAVPQNWQLAQRLVDQTPAYGGMVKGLIDIFQSMDMFLKALVKQGDKVKANIPKVGLDKTYTQMKKINQEDFLQIVQVLSEYVQFECGQHESISKHVNSNLPVWRDMLDAWTLIADDDTWP